MIVTKNRHEHTQKKGFCCVCFFIENKTGNLGESVSDVSKQHLSTYLSLEILCSKEIKKKTFHALHTMR